MTPAVRPALFALAAALSVAACGPGAPAGIDVRRYCAARVSCDTSATSTAVVACIQQRTPAILAGLDLEARREVDCYLNAASCAAAADCVARMHGGSYCSGNMGVSCDGNVLVTCPGAGQPASSFDCARVGMQCRSTGTGTAQCTNGRTCSGNADGTCDGNVLRRCENSLENAVDCGAFVPGTRCAMITDVGRTQARCLPDTMACDPAAFTQRCQAGARVICLQSTQRELTIPCAAGETCTVTGARAECVPETTDCTDGEADACDATRIRVCMNARRSTIECNVVGATGCVASAGQARCR